MRKYLVIYKATLLENLQYFASIMLSFISYVVMIFIFVMLWQYIYTDPSELIAGYSMEQMIWYVMITEVVWFGTRTATVSNQVITDIRSGSIAYGINKPYHYSVYILTKYMGEISIKMPVYVLLAALIGTLMAGPLPGFSIQAIPAIALCMLLGIIISAVIKLSISQIAFWIEDSTPFLWIYDKLLLIVGTIFPIEMFPEWLQPFIRYSPVYTVIYGPVKLVVDFSFDKFIEILVSQLIYLVASFMLMFFIYSRGVKKINVNGG